MLVKSNNCIQMPKWEIGLLNQRENNLFQVEVVKIYFGPRMLIELIQNSIIWDPSSLKGMNMLWKYSISNFIF